MGTDDIPPSVIEAEKKLWYWGTHDPRNCVLKEYCEDDKEEARKLGEEIQYHLGSFNAALSMCNALYSVEEIEGRNLPREKQSPPWLGDAVAELCDLQSDE